MEVYLKQLFLDFERNSENIQIVEDNASSWQPSSPPSGKAGTRSRRRHEQMRRILEVSSESHDNLVSDELHGSSEETHTYLRHPRHSRSFQQGKLPTHNDNDNRKLTARMERHRMSRWESCPSTLSESPFAVRSLTRDTLIDEALAISQATVEATMSSTNLNTSNCDNNSQDVRRFSKPPSVPIRKYALEEYSFSDKMSDCVAASLLLKDRVPLAAMSVPSFLRELPY
mmetsp:Transcript_16729/g.38253  ORF Transcript_16729/g.38253 Transcript_16729/m.38253 type:complete len:228 (+) Transcript_16729:213-896(+)